MAHRNLPGLLRARGLNTLTAYESEVSSETTAIVGEFLAVDTTSAAVTINQPELPDVGSLFGVYDSRENAGTNNITVVFTDPLHGTVQNHVISTDQGSAKFRYIDTDIGWVIYDDGKAASGGGTVNVVSNVTQDRILGRISSGSGNSEELTKAQMLTFLNVEDGASADLTLATEVAANATAVIGEDLPVNSTAAARTITAPSSPSAGDIFGVFDSRGTAAENNITISAFTHHGSSQPYVLSINGAGVKFRYVDATIGWKIDSEVN